MSNNSDNPQLNQLVSFIQHDLPGLEDGRYQLKVDQQIVDKKGNIVSDASLAATYQFGVAGDRFRLAKPTEMVYSVFPADMASGKYNTVLPSAVLTKTTFPWSRIPTNSIDDIYKGNTPQPGQDTDVDVPTWLTILLLDEDDVAAYSTAFPQFALPPVSATIGDLFAQTANPNSTLGNNYSYFRNVTSATPPLTSYMDPGDQLTDLIQVLDIPVPLFVKIAPTIKDLTLMAHIRKVSLINKPTMAGISDVGEPVGSFSIVFGNRLPNPMRRTSAYLVSLEQLADFLPTSEEGGVPTSQSGFTPDLTKTLRLAVLKSWTFFSTGDNASFVNQLNALNNAQAVVPPKANADAPASMADKPVIINENLTAITNLRLTCGDDALPIVKSALQMGYVPINHHLRTGENVGNTTVIDKTVSWYRGPLVPYQIDKAAIKLPIGSPDQVTVFDPTTGMLDTSYAAAWTLGRQLALQDTNFSTTLYNWKRGVSRLVVNSIEQSLLANNFSNVLAKVQPATPAADQALPEDGPVKKLKAKRAPRGEFTRQLLLSLQKPKQ